LLLCRRFRCDRLLFDFVTVYVRQIPNVCMHWRIRASSAVSRRRRLSLPFIPFLIPSRFVLIILTLSGCFFDFMGRLSYCLSLIWKFACLECVKNEGDVGGQSIGLMETGLKCRTMGSTGGLVGGEYGAVAKETINVTRRQIAVLW
jgi:hypothetical protein